jgi:hypothetical protein
VAKEYEKFTIVAFRQGGGAIQTSVTNTDEKATRKSTKGAEGFTFLGFKEFSGKKFEELIRNQPTRGVIRAEQLKPALQEIAAAAFSLGQEVQNTVN